LYPLPGVYNVSLEVFDELNGVGRNSTKVNVLPDTTPPSAVRNLNESKVGKDYILWEWENPEDEDFSHVMVYLDDEFKGNVTGTQYNATNLLPNTTYKLGIKTVDKNGNINNTLVEDYARTLELWINKTWETMTFAERKALVEEFLRVDPTPYSEINQCLLIADRLYQNATRAKELYGLPDNIPMQLDLRPFHIMNAVLLGDNKSNIEHWGWINEEDYVAIFDKNITIPIESSETDYIWKNGEWIIPNELYRLTNYTIGFNITWEPYQLPNITIIYEYPREYQDVYPA